MNIPSGRLITLTIVMMILFSHAAVSPAFATLAFEPWEDEVFVAIGIECGPGGKCEQGMAASVNLPNFFQIDVSAMEITTLSESDNKRTSTIKIKELLDGKLFLQGADDGIEGVRDGLVWSISITQDTGRLVLSAAGGNEAFVIFGACTPR